MTLGFAESAPDADPSRNPLPVMSSDHPHDPESNDSQTPATHSRSQGPLIIGGLVLLLLVLHQDNWFWADGTLVFGFVPIGLFWHAMISIGAGLTWALATKIAWPIDDEVTVNRGGDHQ